MPCKLKDKRAERTKAGKVDTVMVFTGNDDQMLTRQRKNKNKITQLPCSSSHDDQQTYSKKRCQSLKDKCSDIFGTDANLVSKKNQASQSTGSDADKINKSLTQQSMGKPQERQSRSKRKIPIRSRANKRGSSIRANVLPDSTLFTTDQSLTVACTSDIKRMDRAEMSEKNTEPENQEAVWKNECAEIKSEKFHTGSAGENPDVKGIAKFVGAHCSIAGALSNAVEEAVALGGTAFGLFVRSQRTWTVKPMTAEAAEDFRAACTRHGFSPSCILPHGSYLMNCCSPNPETLQKSRHALLDELQRCEALGLTLYNFHPGSTCGEITVEEALDRIADSINMAHEQTKYIVTVIENMCGQGHTIGGRFEELRGIIDRVKNKSRIGVCLDTCHAFAAGNDLSTKEGYDKFITEFDSIVGFKYLRAMHLNDSKGPLGCHLDRHENIGKGHIGLDGFRRIMNDEHFNGIPMILETPTGDYTAEVKTLYSLVQK